MHYRRYEDVNEIEFVMLYHFCVNNITSSVFWYYVHDDEIDSSYILRFVKTKFCRKLNFELGLLFLLLILLYDFSFLICIQI